MHPPQYCFEINSKAVEMAIARSLLRRTAYTLAVAFASVEVSRS